MDFHWNSNEMRVLNLNDWTLYSGRGRWRSSRADELNCKLIPFFLLLRRRRRRRPASLPASLSVVPLLLLNAKNTPRLSIQTSIASAFHPHGHLKLLNFTCLPTLSVMNGIRAGGPELWWLLSVEAPYIYSWLVFAMIGNWALPAL